MLAWLIWLLPCGAARAQQDTALADRAFQAAHRDFSNGEYESALRGYKEAYRIKPHPNILYNLALTSERLLDYDAAIDHFQRFLATPLPTDPEAARAQRPFRLLAERSLRRLRSLPARVSVSAFPERVQVTALPLSADGQPGPPRFTGYTPAVFTLPAGRYLLQYRQPGYLDVDVPLDVHVGQALLVQRQLPFRARPLHVESSPRARLFLDDRLIGQTPFSSTIGVGPHLLRLERRFYLTHQVPLSVKPGDAPLRYRATLVQDGRYEAMLGALVAGAGLGLVALRIITRTEVENITTQELYQPIVAALVPGALSATLVGFLGGHPSASQAQMLVGNGAWGTLIGFGLGLGIDPLASKTERIFPHVLAATGGFLGVMAGLGADRRWHPDSGTVALYNSGALWGSTLGALGWALLLTRDPSSAFIGRPSQDRTGDGGWLLMSGAAAGIGTGLLLSNLKALRGISRSRVALLDLGGLVGGVVAGGLGLGIGYGVTRSIEGAGTVAVPCTMGGIVLGLVGAGLLTRRW